MENFKFNTMISALMEFSNHLTKHQGGAISETVLWQQAIDTLLLMLAPLAPFMAEELWRRRGHTDSIHLQHWPQYDSEALIDKSVTVPIQVNGKLRDTITIATGLDREAAVQAAKSSAKIALALENKKIIKIIWVQDKLLNLVVK